MRTSIDGKTLKKMVIFAAQELQLNKQLIDSLNVFPVPDGDTGTNMSLTTLAAAKEVEKLEDIATVTEVAKAASSGSLRGARGNSGVILSQLFRGLSKGLEGKKTADVDDLAVALKKATDIAYKAVMKPKEGTMLTISREIAHRAAELAYETDDIEKFLKEVIAYGKIILSKTKDMLPQLKQAGVVDAGGKGIITLLEGAYMSMFVEGDFEYYRQHKDDVKAVAPSLTLQTEEVDITFGYCTEFFIVTEKAEDEKVLEDLGAFLNDIGDSVVLVSDDDIIKIHVHTNNPGLVLEKALSIGSISNIKIDNMREQHNESIYFAEDNKEKNTAPPKEKAIVAVSFGEGLNNLFYSLGADIVLEGGQTMNPSTEDILNAIERANATNIILLPNNKNIVMSAEQAAKLCEYSTVTVLPTTTIQQGLNSLVVYQETISIEDNVKQMTESYNQVKSGQVTIAVRETQYDGQDIEEGDFLGIQEGKIVVVDKELKLSTMELIAKMVDNESSMISVFYGLDVSKDDATALVSELEAQYSDFEIELQDGGQPVYHYLVSVE